LSQFTRVTDGRSDGQTDRQTEFSSLDRVCFLQRVKNQHNSKKKQEKYKLRKYTKKHKNTSTTHYSKALKHKGPTELSDKFSNRICLIKLFPNPRY